MTTHKTCLYCEQLLPCKCPMALRDEMIAALRAAYNSMMEASSHDMKTARIVSAAIHQARAAIAKAEGR